MGLALPLDAAVRGVVVDRRVVTPVIARLGDVQTVAVTVAASTPRTSIAITYDEGSDVYLDHAPAAPGARSQGLRVLRSRADPSGLRLTLEGRAGRDYSLTLASPARLGPVEGLVAEPIAPGRVRLKVRLAGTEGDYVRREFRLPLLRR